MALGPIHDIYDYIKIMAFTIKAYYLLVYQGHFLLGGLPKGGGIIPPPRVLFSRFIPHPTKLIKDLFYSLSYRGMIWLTKTHISPIIRQIHANLHEILVFILIYTCTANKAKTCKHIPCIYPLHLILKITRFAHTDFYCTPPPMLFEAFLNKCLASQTLFFRLELWKPCQTR